MYLITLSYVLEDTVEFAYRKSFVVVKEPATGPAKKAEQNLGGTSGNHKNDNSKKQDRKMKVQP